MLKNESSNNELASDDDFNVLGAALFSAIGTKTKISKSGFSVIFKPEYAMNRADLSGNILQAKRQLEYAGIDIESVTQQQIDSYLRWRKALNEEKAKKHARILITRKTCEPYSGSFGSCGVFNYLKLIDGLGRELYTRRIECCEYYDPQATNQIGGEGAFCYRPDYQLIEKEIERLRGEYPIFVKAPITDNNNGINTDMNDKENKSEY
ncbi:TPA: hypothetical protein OOF39_004532 [Kluyvera ascorbata]|nr:hypothetical protein [Salmonella enterica]HCR3985034.1 hypothetical protein [Kluyvera ascorbata]